MSPLTSYRRLFGLTGPAYVVVAFLARLPLAMSQLGTLLLVAGTTGSYGAGGACAGALALTNAVGAPLWGGWSDRLGQHKVIAVQSLGAAAAIAVLLLTANSALPWGWSMTASAVAGFLLPQIGPMARARWRPITALTATAPGQHRLLLRGCRGRGLLRPGPSPDRRRGLARQPDGRAGRGRCCPRRLRHLVRPA